MSTTRISRRVHASRERVYRAFLDPRDVAIWKVPTGMTCEVHTSEPQEGGAIRISLTYEESATAGKTNAHTDTYHGRFVKLIPNEEIVEVVEFETPDPTMQGEMTLTTTFREVDGGTEVISLHEGVPPGISPSDNELGWTEAFDKLAALVEAGQDTTPPG
ncbi:uncharacterized protein YndB with AHSA1/START domain [Roseimicrobium gellanilyticum]|uniref:Uncharacterized protein YndB with AHSA1/START domain n=1 Tax=Roseimicrobium gellanilyticum TaxID=748857 RepID=A0A366HNL8_9BACT|nr:SRPBCC domain-containing protein [Roseimicrobium gellanilyticum]RBP43912.1 uncharacterized protein YndB with AHSA1/START domain [Roseimicrobium gellanilyticum]